MKKPPTSSKTYISGKMVLLEKHCDPLLVIQKHPFPVHPSLFCYP